MTRLQRTARRQGARAAMDHLLGALPAPLNPYPSHQTRHRYYNLGLRQATALADQLLELTR